MKKRYVQKMTTILLTAAMICSSVPVTAETVSENEAVVETEAVDNTQNDSTENEQTDADINKEGAYAGEYGDSDIEENRADMDADYEQEDQEDEDDGEDEEEEEQDDEYVDSGYVNGIGYTILKKVDEAGNEVKYVRITKYNDTYTNNPPKEVVIPAEIEGIPVTQIDDFAFEGGYFEKITIPDTVEKIDSCAFYRCGHLQEITLPDSVKEVGAGIFSRCYALKSVVLSKNITNICNMFTYCESLVTVTIPDGVTSIDGAFGGCSSLEEISIPESVTGMIGEWTFGHCSNLKTITIPKGITGIGEFAFGRCINLESVSIPDSVTEIGQDAFWFCEKLKDVNIPDGVTRIGGSAFEYCENLTSITIPSSAVDLGEDDEYKNCAFSGCGGLASIKVEEGNPVYDSRNDCNAIIKTASGELLTGCNNTSIPDGVVTIRDYAFMDCNNLKNVTIPKSVTMIKKNAFSDCGGIESITVEEGNTVYDSRDNCNAVIGTEGTIIELVLGCKNTVIPSDVTTIGAYAFSGCKGIINIVIPDNVTQILEGAFEDCSGLQSIVLPASLTTIEAATFRGCTGLKEFVIPEGITTIGNSAFANSGITSIEFPEGLKNVGDWAGIGGIFGSCDSLKSIVLPADMTQIWSALSLYSCPSLTNIKVKEGNPVYDSRNDCNAIIETATNALVFGCSGTKIPDSVRSIEAGAFGDCKGLKTIEIPDSVERIGSARDNGEDDEEDGYDGCASGAFAGSDLESIVIPQSVKTIGDRTFAGCENLKNVTFQGNLDELGNGAFEFCSSLKNITIPAGITTIKERAFYASGLTSITIPESVTSLGDESFGAIKEAVDIYYAGSAEQWNDLSSSFAFWNGPNSRRTDYTVHYGKETPDPDPSEDPDDEPSPQPSEAPSAIPSEQPSATPSAAPSQQPSTAPSAAPSQQPNTAPSAAPSKTPEADVPAAGTTLKEKTGREFQVTEADPSESKPSVTITKLSAKDKKAKKVTIPKTVTVDNVEYQVTSIAAKAFKNSKKLQTVVIPDTITEIGAGSFEGCKNLKSVTIGKNVTSIGKNAFKNCKNLKKITVKSAKLKKVGKGALTGINKNCVIKVPKKQLKSYKSLLKGKGQKKSVKITK